MEKSGNTHDTEPKDLQVSDIFQLILIYIKKGLLKMIPYSIFSRLPKLKEEITPTLYERVIRTLSVLAALGKLNEADGLAVSRYIDGACIQWTRKKVYCYLIEVDESDEVAELNGCYFVCRPVSKDDPEITSEVAETLVQQYV